MKLAVGLVIKGGKQFIDKWLECAIKIADVILVVDNGTDIEVMNKLLSCNKVKQYIVQKDKERNMSRDYQKILEMAREEDCQWVLNLDIDEYIPNVNKIDLKNFLINAPSQSVGFPLFEMRNDNKHYVMVIEMPTGQLKHGRACHKCYKVLSHLEFDKKDKHGISIPHNCISGGLLSIPIQHFGHYTKELREEKRKQYSSGSFKDMSELNATWMEDDDSKVTIKKWEDLKL